MANIKSQKKRITTNEKSRMRNRAVKRELKTANRRMKDAVAAGNGAVLLLETLQLPGGKPLSVLQLLNARRDQLAPGQVFGI